MRSKTVGGREFPRVDEFHDLYELGWQPRYGEMSMIAARSGAGKSTFGLFYALKSGLKTMYFSGDMSAFQASVKLACAVRHEDIETVVSRLDSSERQGILEQIPTNITLVFGEITFAGINRHLDAYVELYNEYPELIVIDNLMDIDGCQGDYTAQTDAMQWLHVLNRDIGSAVWVMAHASDKGERGRNSPHEPPPRAEIKNGLSEKPETVLSVALNPHTNELNVAIVKQRLGASDPSGRQYVSITAIPEESRYVRKGGPLRVVREEERRVRSEAYTSSDQRPEPPSGSELGTIRFEGSKGARIRFGEAPTLG